tara:strand:- start:298 stop:1182 length:885 start_codon:yes stop_codon:yes gene_type:complete
MSKYSIFHIEGGLGKHIAATAVAKCIKTNHPDRKLIIVSGWPQVFVGLDFVDRVYRHNNTPYFYEEYIKDKDSIIFRHEPYYTTEHIIKRKPLIENWCKLYKLKYNNETPELKFNVRQQQIGTNKWKRDKPVLLIHTNGGPIQGQKHDYAWTRDLPGKNIAEVANHYMHEGYHIIQVCRKKEQCIEGMEHVYESMNNLEFFQLLQHSDKRLLIDSCLQHAAYAMKLPSTVCWIGTSPKIFGYDFHNNITTTLPKYNFPDRYMFDSQFTGETIECPFDDMDILDSEKIVDSLEKQ